MLLNRENGLGGDLGTDLEALLLDETSLLDVELLLGLGVNLLGLFVGLLLDEGHHVLDLEEGQREKALR